MSNDPSTTEPSTAMTKAEPRLSYGGVSMERAGGGGMLVAQTFGEVVAFAEVMSRASLALPKHLRGNAGACMAVTMQAMRWEMDPFAVANKTYEVNDRLAYEAQLVAAVVNTRAPIIGRPAYAYEGEGPTRTCTITCVMLDGEVRDYTSPKIGGITTKNSPQWKYDPDQQLGYFAIRAWARRHAPEVLLGVYTPEELKDAEVMRNVSREGTGVMARLQAAKAGAPGYDEQHVHDTLDASVDTPKDEHDADGVVIEDDAEEGEEAEFTEAAEDDDFPGDR